METLLFRALTIHINLNCFQFQSQYSLLLYSFRYFGQKRPGNPPKNRRSHYKVRLRRASAIRLTLHRNWPFVKYEMCPGCGYLVRPRHACMNCLRCLDDFSDGTRENRREFFHKDFSPIYS